MSFPRISIILPCFNGANVLGYAIDSVLNQTFKDWELIVVDDCSTDNTLEVANAYAEKDNRIRVLRNEHNSKLPATLNHGFSKAKGDYWTWTSDDNLLHPNFCEEMSMYLDEHSEVGLVVGGMEIIDENGNVCQEFIPKPVDLQSRMMLNNFVGACFMYRSVIAKRVGEYRTDLFLVEDYEYWMRMNTLTKVAVLNKNLYSYRVHSRSLTATHQKEIQEKLVRLRISYRNQTEQQLQNNPELLRLFYYRIIDHLNGKEKWLYYWDFASRLPLHFGLRYIFIHIPHQFYQRIRKKTIN